ncbi:MAG: hypothetical protein NTU73_06110 [Ignavibacteriae bacterium]|nr:hypothetical protein [Ignavibacteriota bacterium]
MKRNLILLIILFTFSSIYYSCNKDATNPISSKPVNYFVTNTYKKSTNKGIPNVDTLSIADIGSMVSLKFTLDTILNIDGNQKLDVVILHNGIVDTLIKQFTNPSFSSYNFQNVLFTDSVSNFIQSGLQNYSGAYKPYKPLSIFNGQSLTGPWYLIINYPTLIRTGVIKSWGITVSYNTPTPPPSSGNILPLSVGNYWIFAVDTGGVQNVKQDTLHISGQSVVHGKQVYWWQWNNNPYIWYMKNENDGLWVYGNNFDTISPPNLQIKYPINLNETYIAYHFMNAVDTITCVSLNVMYSNIQGCINYYEQYYSYPLYNFNNLESPNSFTQTNFYFKPGVGYIGYNNDTQYPSYNTQTIYRLLIYYVH